MIKIGIDPDLDKSGFALTYQQTKEVTTYTISELLGRIVQLMEQFPSIPLHVYIEFGELNKSNFHIGKIPAGVRDIKAYCAQIGANTGKNFAAAKLILDLISSMGINCIKVRPTNRKIDAATFKKLSGISKRTNQEMRDAYMLIIDR